MRIFAGIDEAGYGPMFGPLVIGRAVFGLDAPSTTKSNSSEPAAHDQLSPPAHPPDFWEILGKAVCKDLPKRTGLIAVNDSKKLHTSASRAAARRDSSRRDPANVRHLEIGVLSFAALLGHSPATVAHWLDCLGETSHRQSPVLPWYEPADERPWELLPIGCTAGELAIARSMLNATASQAGFHVLDLGAAVVFEDKFNRMAAATRSKAATSFTFVSAHLRSIWDRFGRRHPHVVVDRQSGRTHYRELLALAFPETSIRVLDESPQVSAYELITTAKDSNTPSPRMRVSFEVQADGSHMPVALASMVSKYTRELLMHRFNAYFTHHAPHIKPTAGYALDAKRFWRQLEPVLPSLDIAPQLLKRMS